MISRRSLITLLVASCLLAVASGSALAASSPPGDIPDNQAYVSYKGSGYSLKTPEGWARTSNRSTTTFSDKYNSIAVDLGSSARAPSTVSVRMADVTKLKALHKHFQLVKVMVVKRTAGAAVVVVYRADSAPNAVTGKVITNDFERYSFWKAGKLATLTLQGPKGSDNVDPWRIVTSSFRWS